MNKEIRDLPLLQKAGVFALACFGLLALSGVWYMYKCFSHQDARTFAVSGKGEVEVTANKATINADFMGEGATPEEAAKKLTDATKKAYDGLSAAGVTEAMIKTQNVSSNPKYEYCYNYPQASYPAWCKNNPSQNRVVGYEATQNFEVKITDNKELVEKVLGLFPTLGARNMNGPMWEVDNKDAIQQAREKAIQEARSKAEGIAKGLGMRLGDVQYYSEDQGGGYPVPMMYGKGGAVMSTRMEIAPQAAMDASIPVSQGTDKVTVNVNITYELK
jgi:uncharacterized protein YggE